MRKILLYFLIFSFLHGNNVGIPDNTCALIVASRQTKADVKAYIDDNITYTKYVTLYQANNGWYAIALGFLKDNESKSIMKQWKNSGKIPYDSFCTHGNKFQKEIFINNDSIDYSYIPSSSTTRHKIANNKNESKNSSKHIDKKNLKCLALTWGPDVCSQQFSEYAKKNDDMDDISDIIKSPACATMITKILGEQMTQNDVEISMITGALDDAGESGTNSDNGFYKFLGGVAYLYSFGIKASIYQSCMNK